ncbi:unnamed protein product, partial [Iphiclides podalirius]
MEYCYKNLVPRNEWALVIASGYDAGRTCRRLSRANGQRDAAVVGRLKLEWGERWRATAPRRSPCQIVFSPAQTDSAGSGTSGDPKVAISGRYNHLNANHRRENMKKEINDIRAVNKYLCLCTKDDLLTILGRRRKEIRGLCSSIFHRTDPKRKEE